MEELKGLCRKYTLMSCAALPMTSRGEHRIYCKFWDGEGRQLRKVVYYAIREEVAEAAWRYLQARMLSA